VVVVLRGFEFEPKAHLARRVARWEIATAELASYRKKEKKKGQVRKGKGTDKA
jgi:hypothetical protein